MLELQNCARNQHDVMTLSVLRSTTVGKQSTREWMEKGGNVYTLWIDKELYASHKQELLN